MRFPQEAHQSSGRVGQALRKAATILDEWGERTDNKRAYDELLGWPGLELVDEIATALLEAQGCDVETLQLAVDAAEEHGAAILRDAMAEWERNERDRRPASLGERMRAQAVARMTAPKKRSPPRTLHRWWPVSLADLGRENGQLSNLVLDEHESGAHAERPDPRCLLCATKPVRKGGQP